MMVVIYPAIIISKKMRNEVNVKDFKKAIFHACPRWLSMMTGLLAMYALASLIFFIFKKYFAGSSDTNGKEIMDNGFRGFSGHWMVFYALAFQVLYSCRRLKKRMLVESYQSAGKFTENTTQKDSKQLR